MHIDITATVRELPKLNDKPLKLVDLFVYLGSNISSIESDVITRIGNAWAAIKKLTII